MAGWAGVRLMTFLVLDLIGTMLWTGMLIGLARDHR
jgi:membrane protein DedA with SNARE-associated domain